MPIYRRKGSPHWWISISIEGRKTRRTSGTSDRRQAEEFEERERARLWRVHKLNDGSAIRFKEAAADWLSDIPEASRRKEESIVDWFIEQLEDDAVGTITREVIAGLRELSIEEGRSKSTVDRHMAVLRAILNRAAAAFGFVAPAVPMFNPPKRDMNWLTHEQFKRLERELPKHLALSARFAVYSGLRMRSMLRLTWDRIDLRRRRLWIPGTQMKGKNAHGLPVNRELAKVLREAKTLNPAGDHVFQYDHAPIDDCNTEAFRKAVERAGVGPLRWHDLRHTFAAWAVQSGVTLMELMQLGGWKTYSSVLRYAHLAPDHLAQAADRVARSGHSRKPVKREKRA
jgi:integrase